MKNIEAKDFEKLLHDLRACKPAKEWAQGKDLTEVWSTCERVDWMFWLLEKMADKSDWLTRKEIVSIACDIAETALKYVKPNEDRPKNCIQTIRNWILGIATIQDVAA